MTAEDRRVAILGAALEVFARRGYHAASIDEIAQAAGISKALIYEHFRSKRDLHASLLARHVDEILAALERSAAGLRSSETRLRAGVDAFLEWVETRGDAFRLLFRDVFEPDVAHVLRRVERQATAGIAALIAEQGDHSRTVETYAQLLSGSMQSLAIWWQDHPQVDRQFLVNCVMEFAWSGLERVARRRGRAG